MLEEDELKAMLIALLRMRRWRESMAAGMEKHFVMQRANGAPPIFPSLIKLYKVF